MEFDFDNDITQIWDASIKEHHGSYYLITNNAYNSDVPPGGTVTFGFNVGKGSSNVLLNNVKVLENKIEEIAEFEAGQYILLSGEIVEDTDSLNIYIDSDYRAVPYNLYLNERGIKEEIVTKGADSEYCLSLNDRDEIFSCFATQELDDSTIISNELVVKKINGKFEIEVIDTDGDGIEDYLEKSIGTDWNRIDSDNDGLTDYFEWYELGSDPLNADTNNNGISDGMEDSDGDQLLDMQEMQYGTDPFDEDTDGDKLTDYEEINIYKTDPLDNDTDLDDMYDGDEIKMGKNPLEEDENGNGIETGGEIGVYYRYARKALKKAEEKIGKWYETNQDNLWDMDLSLIDKKTSKNIFSVKKSHWWLTGFKWGRYTSDPANLKIKACITFPNEQLKQAFIEGYDSGGEQYFKKAKKDVHDLNNDDHSDDGIYGLKESGYVVNSSYVVNGNEVTVYFDVPKCKQPKDFKTKRIKLKRQTLDEVLAYRAMKRINSLLTGQEYSLNDPNNFDASACTKLTTEKTKSIVKSLYKNNKDCYESFDDFLRKKGKTKLANKLSNALKKNNWKKIKNNDLKTLRKYLKKYYDKMYIALKKSPAKMIDSLMGKAGDIVKEVFE